MSLMSKYFNWLQKDAPVGVVELYPSIDEKNETSGEGIFIIGDLTGIPLLKFAAESGKEIITQFENDSQFQERRKNNSENEIYDLMIIGAGPAGISAGIEAVEKDYKFKILESSEKFSTILNFPKGKPIYAEPVDFEQAAELKIDDGTKESLLKNLEEQVKDVELPIDEGVMVQKIIKRKDFFEIVTKDKNYKSLRVILAIGKSGSARKLNCLGEDLPHVFNRIFDPADAEGEDVMVVGGGDTALETAIAIAEHANSVTISYRKDSFSRPKEGNQGKIDKLVNAGKIKLKMNTEVKEIKKDSVVLKFSDGKEEEIKSSMVFTMIGRELTTDFFKRSGIKMEGEQTTISKLQFALLILFSCVLYFGKSSADFYKSFFGKLDSWSELFSKIFTSDFWYKFLFVLPGDLTAAVFSEQVRIWNVTKYINAVVAYIAFIGLIVLGIYLLINFLKNYTDKIKPDWRTFKYAYFIFVAIFFAIIFFGERYFGLQFLDKSQSFWYTGFYSLTILIFGLRRIKQKPTKYIKLQTWTLILIQAIPLFILPEILLPLFEKLNMLGNENGFIYSQVFPDKSYWRAYGFILAWPLNFSNLFNSNITAFWLWFSLFQTFVFIPIIVYKWGKGAYCGWICSCGALAETLGDEYRTLAPHGPKAKRWENFGQWALLAAFLITGTKLLSILFNTEIPIINEDVRYVSDFFQKIYYIGIDVIFAGVLGLGVYFFLSGRVWCRFGCPLAALMHIYNRFSRYRIFSEKKKCISCNICTKVCHMGIDVMNYANKGIPMNDVECVRCSACVVNCPTEVLSFGSIPKTDLDNKLYKEVEIDLKNKSENWASGL